MLIFPISLVPNYVKITSLPKYQRAQMAAKNNFYKTSILLSNTSTGGSLDLIYKNYPTKPITIPALRPNAFTESATAINQIGWVGAWQFYHEQTKDGHLCFTIPPTHKLWDRTDYKVPFLQYSLDNLGIIWRIDNFTNDNADNIKQVTNFTISISAELRTPLWI